MAARDGLVLLLLWALLWTGGGTTVKKGPLGSAGEGTEPPPEEAAGPPGYTPADALEPRLRALVAAAAPGRALLYSLGRSVVGRELWVLRVGTVGAPQVKLVGNMHGNEALSRELLVRLAALLLGPASAQPRLQRLLNSTELHLLPSLNPDGFAWAQEGDCTGVQGRNNARDSDLNRGFPDQYSQPGPDRDKEPEVWAVMEWIRNNSFLLSGNLHGGSVVASYPFDDTPAHQPHGTYSRSPDDKLFRYLARAYAEKNPIMNTGHPNCPGDPKESFEDGITNGAQWYDVAGLLCDNWQLCLGISWIRVWCEALRLWRQAPDSNI